MELVLRIIGVMFIVRWHQAVINGYSLTNATDSVLGCSHNNTRFANGSFVPSVEPCLNCKCINSNLICSLRVCPEQAFPPPRGCVIVQKKNTCCPFMICSKLQTTNKDKETKVVTHDRKWYEQNIRNRIFSQNALQRRIEDSDEVQQVGNGKMCVHNGTVYRSGSAMGTSSLCTYCYCIQGKQKCIQPKCTLPAKGCEPILIDSSCCPIRYDCTEKKTIKARYNTKYKRRRNGNKHYLRMTSRMQRSRGCLVDSTFYPEGHKLPANQTNPCEICFCIGGSKRCTPKKCAPMIRNCKPIIPDGQCCPSSYDCNNIAEYKSARGITSRQYSDFFSLLFGDEDKENSTAPSWDYEADTEQTNLGLFNATNEEDLLDVINDSLKYADAADTSKQTAQKQTNISNQILHSVPSNVPSYNISGMDVDGVDNIDEEDDDEDEISLLDFFLKGDSALSATTAKPFIFNITGNSPMQIQPVLPDNMKNESLKFSMLPMSLYNMVKDDGSLMFEDEKNQTRNVTSYPLIVPELKHANKEIQSELSTQKSGITSVSRITSAEIKATTHTPAKQSTTKSTIKNSESNNLNVRKKFNQTMNMNINKTESENVKNSVNETESTTQKVIELSPKIGINNTTKMKTTSTTVGKTVSSTTEKTTKTTTATVAAKIATTTTKKITTTRKPAAEIASPMPTKKAKEPLKRTTTNAPRIVSSTTQSTVKMTTTESTTATSTQITTTHHPKITAVQINSNPSILDANIIYDYSEPGELPSSLPNLKIIPFLPQDALKNIIHQNDGYKSNYNYYQSNPNSYANHHEMFTDHSVNSPFNIKPNDGDKHPTYIGNVADDRIDYDSYKIPSHPEDNLDYVNVYAVSGDNMIQPSSFQMSVNSKLDYGNPDQKVVNVKPIPGTVNRNLTVKPPLPPFEPEYNLYNLPPQPQQNQPQLQVGNTYANEYSLNGAAVNEPYSPEHNYNVPHFVTMPPLKKPLPRPINNKESIFSYGHKNKFIPPAKTEGGFIPKRPSIPLHGSIDNKILASNFVKNSTETSEQEPVELPEITNPPTENVEITYKPSEDPNAFLGVDILGPYKKEIDQFDLSAPFLNDSNITPNQNINPLNSLYGILFPNEEETSKTSVSTTMPTTTVSTTSVSTVKPPSKNFTNNAIPLKLITILNNTKKESPTKIEIPQRKNNKIIDPTDEPLLEDSNLPFVATTEMSKQPSDLQKNDNVTTLRDVFLSSLNRPSMIADVSEDVLHKSPLFLSRPINKLSPSFIGNNNFPNINSLELKHAFQTKPIRSELDLIIPELNKNHQANDLSHTNNFGSEHYQVLPTIDEANTESYVVNPVDVDKLQQHKPIHGETEIFTPPHKDPAAGLQLKLAGCNIYERMYRVGMYLNELSSSCLECRCTVVGVSCTPLNCA